MVPLLGIPVPAVFDIVMVPPEGLVMVPPDLLSMPPEF